MSNEPIREGLVILSGRALNQGRPKEEIVAALISRGCDRQEASRLIAAAASRVARRKAEQATKRRAAAVWTMCVCAALLAAVLSVLWERAIADFGPAMPSAADSVRPPTDTRATARAEAVQRAVDPALVHQP